LASRVKKRYRSKKALGEGVGGKKVTHLGKRGKKAMTVEGRRWRRSMVFAWESRGKKRKY